MARPKKSLAKVVTSRGISGRALAFVTVLFLMALTLFPPMQRYFAQRAQINALHGQLAESKAAVAQAKADLAKWDDPTYVAQQARTRLHFVFPGETQYSVIGAPDPKKSGDAPAAPVASQVASGLPWYGRLISSITITNTGTNP